MDNFFKKRLILLVVTTIAYLYSVNMAFPIEQHETESSLASKNVWKLSQVLAHYQHSIQQFWPIVPEDPYLLKLGTKNRAVLLLRERLRVTDDLKAEDDLGTKLFDKRLLEAVKIFQERHGLKVDGVVGHDTRLQLNVSADTRLKQISLNMQRWANLSNKLGSRFIMVNIPDFHMYLVDDNHEIMSLRAIVGKPDLPTPELSSKITRIVLNPYWNIPNKIVINDIAPKMLEDPGYLRRMHIRAFRVEDDDSSKMNPNRINWQSVETNGFNYHLRQDPGSENALGLVKFEFQNTHDVYMHDTPVKDLFDQHSRSMSHGCIRLENPFSLVEYLMRDDPNWSEERLQSMLDSGKTHYVKVPRPIPIIITYITAWVDEAGNVNFRNDLYQLDD